MVKDAQVKGLFSFMEKGNIQHTSALKAGMSPNTARRYFSVGLLPSEIQQPHTWRTRTDPFESVWTEVESMLSSQPKLQAKTVFEHLKETHPDNFTSGQLRTLQRKFSLWRKEHGEPKEVFFPQVHYPGGIGASDFTEMNSISVTFRGVPFKHMIYHFVLTYSNWEYVSICFSESYESLSEGLQNALHKCGGSPLRHRTDSLSSAVNNLTEKREFTRRYQGLLSHYRMDGHHTNPASGNENGDVEQRHSRFRQTVDQALMMRDSRDFSGRESYEKFLCQIVDRLNSERKDKFTEECAVLQKLPETRLPDYRELMNLYVRNDSTINILHNIYSIPSRLIGSHLMAHVYQQCIELYFQSKRVAHIPRMPGRGKVLIDYRHVIEWLVKKPGAFKNYKYRSHFFPSSDFRYAYDRLTEQQPSEADKQYLKILELASKESESIVQSALKELSQNEVIPTVEKVEEQIKAMRTAITQTTTEPEIRDVNLSAYDALLEVEAA
jgi:transposase